MGSRLPLLHDSPFLCLNWDPWQPWAGAGQSEAGADGQIRFCSWLGSFMTGNKVLSLTEPVTLWNGGKWMCAFGTRLLFIECLQWFHSRVTCLPCSGPFTCNQFACSGLFWFYIWFCFHSHFPISAEPRNAGSGFFSGLILPQEVHEGLLQVLRVPETVHVYFSVESTSLLKGSITSKNTTNEKLHYFIPLCLFYRLFSRSLEL